METSLSALATLLGASLSGADARVTSISAQSGACKKGALFVALRGVEKDGHLYLDDAFAHGATAAVVEKKEKLGGRPGLVVKDSHRALSRLAGFFAGDPAKEMQVVALTGTNGKTTTNWLIYHALNRLGLPAVRIGTIGIKAEGVVDLPGVLTTPDPISLHQVLRQCVSSDIKACVIEASSHALHQKRVEDIFPGVAVFTNLTRDHLDYHGTMERYAEAKAHLFELLVASPKKTRGAVINLDDECGRTFHARYLKTCNDFSFGKHEDARVKISSFEPTKPGAAELKLVFDGKEHVILTPLIGDHNASNLAAAFASCAALGLPATKIAEALSGLVSAPGRLELVAGPGFSVYVDYAHTPDALERALVALRPCTQKKLWVVFGCGGDRDRGKRPQMGEIAARLADKVVVTSDNPRTEDARSIIEEILSAKFSPAAVEPDRKRAIQHAVQHAESGDVILVAGKGHEDYQIIGKERIHFSDVEEASAAIRSRGAA